MHLISPLRVYSLRRPFWVYCISHLHNVKELTAFFRYICWTAKFNLGVVWYLINLIPNTYRGDKCGNVFYVLIKINKLISIQHLFGGHQIGFYQFLTNTCSFMGIKNKYRHKCGKMIVILWVTLWEKVCKKTSTLKSGFRVTTTSIKLL